MTNTPDPPIVNITGNLVALGPIRQDLVPTYLRWLNDRFGDLDLALMAYNAGPARIRAAIKDKQLDAFRRYPSLVRRDFWRFRKGEGLSGDWAFALREVPKGPVQPASIDEAEVP